MGDFNVGKTEISVDFIRVAVTTMEKSESILYDLQIIKNCGHP